MQALQKMFCEAIKFGTYNCTYTAVSGSGEIATLASCTGGITYTAVTSLTDDTACLEANFIGTACTYAVGFSDKEEDASFSLKISAFLSLALLLF